MVIADCYKITTRNFVMQKLVAVGLMLLFCVLMVAVIAGSSVSAVLTWLENELPLVPHWITHGVAVPLLGAALTFVSGAVLFFVLFWLLPKQHPTPRHALPGAIFSGLLLWALSHVFPLYIGLNKGLGQYGQAFALLFTLLFFCYFLGLIVVFGVEINATLYPLTAKVRAGRPTTSQPVTERIPDPVARPLFAVLGGALALALAALVGRRLA
jgi:uncharacterized BrkB/YihY/UPF0761 family membrane protein